MFRIRQISDPSQPANRRKIVRAQELLRERLSGMPEYEIDELPQRLRDPLRYRFGAMLFVADDLRGKMLGFALCSSAPDIGFMLLDSIVTVPGAVGGVGGALYERVQEAARATSPLGLFFECLPDDADACSEPAFALQNAARLRFYERFGARPITGTQYEHPLSPSDLDMPHLVHDPLGRIEPLQGAELRAVVSAILERKYAKLCSPAYNAVVLGSIGDGPVALREPRYVERSETGALTSKPVVALCVNDRHDIHHVHERGYVEAPVRVKAILAGLLPTGLFRLVEPRSFGDAPIRAVHADELVDYLEAACANVPAGKSVYPYVFPIRNQTRPPVDRAYAAGYYCIDTFTPLNANAYLAARRAVDCTLTAAEALVAGERFAYALVRPPGHHAEHRVFGGFCYFCNGAVAAQRLSSLGKVAILDLDYHHGNGQQDIFYRRADVLTVSIHGHPRFAYPFFTGFDDELGEGEGEGHNLNICLPEQVDGAAYGEALQRALAAITAFAPRTLVVSLGLDTGKGDPTGTWSLRAKDFLANGRAVGALGLPTLAVQEGGYRTASLGANAKAFFVGLTASVVEPKL